MTVNVTLGQRDLVDVVRSAIVRGDYSPNEHLVEGGLARCYGVSRGAVRAALIALASEGLIEREVNRGARVRAISREEAIEIAEVRMALEALCAGKAAERLSDQEAIELVALVDEMEAVQQAGDIVAYSSLNAALHLRVREIAGHETASRIVELVRNQSVRTQFRLGLVPGRMAASLLEHRELVDAIVSRDRLAAEGAMRRHLGSVIATLHEVESLSIR